MKKLFVCLLTVLTVGLFAQELQWQQDFEAALRLSKESGKPVFAFFTGSDWCGWCIRLDREILSKQEMKKYLNDNFILFKADFPQNNPPSNEVMMKNRALMKKYGVRGYPTIIITDASGKALGKTGYMRGGPHAMKKALDKYVKKAPSKKYRKAN